MMFLLFISVLGENPVSLVEGCQSYEHLPSVLQWGRAGNHWLRRRWESEG